jgi:hypothetical protein
MTYLRVTNFDKFQLYKKPPTNDPLVWVKLHWAFWEDELNDKCKPAVRLLALFLVSLAGRDRHPYRWVEWDEKRISRLSTLNVGIVRYGINDLLSIGFIEVVPEEDSHRRVALEPLYKSSTPRARGGAEAEADKEEDKEGTTTNGNLATPETAVLDAAQKREWAKVIVLFPELEGNRELEALASRLPFGRLAKVYESACAQKARIRNPGGYLRRSLEGEEREMRGAA